MEPITKNEYADVCNKLSDRIYNLIPKNSEILTITNVWDLFNVKDFKCNDLGPSMAQAMGALSNAVARYNKAESI